ncbi:hypothetical protein [Paraburkholderia unamae]|uniref:Uncharacterized protein n=1 Tax=Paraburkholderia unamae TaxID=219649 RepID=A0ACC6RUL3_9BURK
MAFFLVTAPVIFAQGCYADDDLSIDGKFIIKSSKDGNIQCALDAAPTFAVESADGQAVIVSERGYVLMSDLKKCRAGSALHVAEIPKGVGFLSDINVSKAVYVSLDFVSTQPMTYLATVARIGSKNNLVNLDGAYIAAKSINQLKKTAFSASGDAGSSTISPDGRYVAPSGQIDCSKEAYPGVWDIANNKRVFVEPEACNDLFKQAK